MKIQEAIQKAIKEPEKWFLFDGEEGYAAGSVQGYPDDTLMFKDGNDGERVVLPAFLFGQVDTPRPAPVDYACDLSRAIDECVRDARTIASCSDEQADSISVLGFNRATERVALRYEIGDEECIESMPVNGWITLGPSH